MDGILVTSGNRSSIAISTITPPHLHDGYVIDNKYFNKLNCQFVIDRSYCIGLLSEKGQQAFFMSDVKLNYN